MGGVQGGRGAARLADFPGGSAESSTAVGSTRIHDPLLRTQVTQAWAVLAASHKAGPIQQLNGRECSEEQGASETGV